MKINNRRPVGKPLPNMYLITIPRCDLPKKFIFRGLEPICNRLLVSKEMHSISYIDSCCKNSSIKKQSLNLQEKSKSFFNKENYFNQILDIESNLNSKNELPPSEINNCVSSQSFSPPVPDKDRPHCSKNTMEKNQVEESDNWIHCKSHLHIFAGNLKKNI